MHNDIRSLVPKSKFDIETANRAIAAGYPAVQEILPELMKWLQDLNWPVAGPLAPFLASIGKPLIPEVRRILGSTDDMWKYWILICIVKDWPRDLVAELRPDLERIVSRPTPGETECEVQLEAGEILEQLRPS